MRLELKMLRIPLFLVLLFSIDASAKLEGEFRKEFIDSTTISCYQNQRAAAENKAMSNKALNQYCHCYASYIADIPNSQMIYELQRGERRLSDFDSTIQLAAIYCTKNYRKY